MNENFRKYLYIFIAVCIFIGVGMLFLKALPFVITIGVIMYLGSKVKGYINNKSNINNQGSSNNNIYENNTEDYSNGEVIDVDYEDVENK